MSFWNQMVFTLSANFIIFQKLDSTLIDSKKKLYVSLIIGDSKP